MHEPIVRPVMIVDNGVGGGDGGMVPRRAAMPSSSLARKYLVDAAYRLDLSEQACIAELARLATSALDPKHPAAAFVTHNGENGELVSFVAFTSSDEKLASTLQRTSEFMPPAVQRQLLRGPPHITTTSRIFGSPSTRRMAFASGAREFAGLVCPTTSGVVVVGTAKSDPLRISSKDQRYWGPIAAHVSAAWRLRHALLVSDHDDRVVFSTKGRALEEAFTEGAIGGPVLGQLREAILQRERLRGQKEGDDMWPALVAGEWTLVDRFEPAGQRLVVAHRNEPPAPNFHVLSNGERCVLQQAMDGVANKAIAIELALSQVSVSRLLASALERLRLKSISEAVAIRGAEYSTIQLGTGAATHDIAVLKLRDRPAQLTADVEAARLTRGERAVLTCVLEGWSNREIASARKTSYRTVANQIAAVFSKLRVSSRRELVAKALR